MHLDYEALRRQHPVKFPRLLELWKTLLSGIYCALAFSAVDASEFKESEKARFLVPCQPPRDFFVGDKKYWNLISKKLFLTPGNYGRVIEIPSFAAEAVVSVDELPGKGAKGERQFAITLTEPSSNLFYTIPQPGPRIDIRPAVNVPDPRSTPPPPVKKNVPIKKVTILIDAAFASAIHNTWVAMLQKSQTPPNNGAIPICGGTSYFYSVQMPNGQTAYAELPLVTTRLPGEFAFVGQQLISFCYTSEKKRPKGQRNILENLARIQAQLARH